MRYFAITVSVALLSQIGELRADDKQEALDPKQLVGAWKLVSGERGGQAMAKESTGGIFVFTKDALTGKSRFGDEKSWMSYTLDTKKIPAALDLTITKGFAGESREAIAEVRDGQLRLCYNLDKKGRPAAFATKAGDNNRLMVFVKAVDPAETQKQVQALSDKKWATLREGKLKPLMELTLDNRFTLTTGDGKRFRLAEDFLDITKFWESGAKEFDRLEVAERSYTVLSDTVTETGRAVATKAGRKDPVWAVRYTTTWARDDGKWYLVSEHQSPAK